MSVGRVSAQAALASVAVLALMAVLAASASAGGVINLCIGSKAGQGVKSGGEGAGKCPAPTEKITYDKVALPKEEAEQQTLLSILAHAKYVASGVGGKPTIQFSGVNVQIVNGEGNTATTNGEGNLVLGYDESPGEQSGSHNLVLGEQQKFTSYGGVVGGSRSTVTAPFASVLSGLENTASAFSASVLTGESDTASESYAAVTGGEGNVSSGILTSVQGGVDNNASGSGASIFGGFGLEAKGNYEAIP
jgi:hypothetical protein